MKRFPKRSTGAIIMTFVALAGLAVHRGALCAESSGLSASVPQRITEAASQRFALVIGNDAYESLPVLMTAVNDAQDVCTELRTLKFSATCVMNVPNRLRFSEIVRRFRESTPSGSTIFLYFAGHGVQIRGENYLLPTNVAALNTVDLEDEGVMIGPLLQSLSEIHGAATVAIFDAAHESTLEPRQLSRLAPGLAPLAPPPRQMLVFLPTAPGATVRDRSGRNSAFARQLLRFLDEPGLPIDDALLQTRAALTSASQADSRNAQVPILIGSLDLRVCLAGCQSTNSVAAVEDMRKQLDDARKRIAELEDERAKSANDKREAAQRITRLEDEIRSKEQTISKVGEQDQRNEQEIALLHRQLDNARSSQLELEKLETALQRVKTLENERAAAVQEKQESAARVASLQQEILQRERSLGAVDERGRQNEDEIRRLRAQLGEVRAKEHDLEQSSKTVSANDAEILDLKNQIEDFKKQQRQREEQFQREQQIREAEYRRNLQRTLERKDADAAAAAAARNSSQKGPPPSF